MNCRFWPEISLCLNEIENEKNRLMKGSINLDTLTSVREKITLQIERLKQSLEQDLEHNFAALGIFAIVAYLDESIQYHLMEAKQGNWDPLQKDFYGAYNAGEMFYETIDKITDDPKVPPIIYEIFYFVLKKGFQGKYRNAKTHISKYLEILKEKIPVALPSQDRNDFDNASSGAKKRIKSWHYYAGVGLATLSLLITLYIISS